MGTVSSARECRIVGGPERGQAFTLHFGVVADSTSRMVAGSRSNPGRMSAWFWWSRRRMLLTADAGGNMVDHVRRNDPQRA